MIPAWHKMLWDEHGSPCPSGDEKIAGFSGVFMPELFHRLYAEEPKDLRADNPVYSKLHGIASELPEFETLRKSTVRDAAWSAMATTAIGESVASAMPDMRSPPPNVERARRVLAGLRGLSEQGLPLGDDIDRAENIVASEEQATADQAEAIDPSRVRTALRRAIADAHEQVDQAQAIVDVLGTDPGVAVDVAKFVRSSEKLSAIVAMAGRLQATARAKRATKSEYARSELVGVEQVGDVGRLLPSELGALASDLRTADLVRRLGERSAMGYRISGREKTNKGPILVCLDASGSMGEGNKDVWSKAISLAVLDIARHENRDFGVCLFNSTVIGTYMEEKFEPKALLDLLSRSPSGGTSFHAPMSWACARIGDAASRKRFSRADVIIVTDGEASCDGATGVRERLDALGAQSFGIVVGASPESLAKWTDKCVAIDDVNHDTKATDIIFGGV